MEPSTTKARDLVIRKGNSYLQQKYDKLRDDLSKEELLEFNESFTLFDKDGSGFIDVNELGLVRTCMENVLVAVLFQI